MARWQRRWQRSQSSPFPPPHGGATAPPGPPQEPPARAGGAFFWGEWGPAGGSPLVRGRERGALEALP
eukprot:15445691-Alexandrium_andersonii.AAC.1